STAIATLSLHDALPISFEMLVCTILNSFYNDGLLDAVTISKIGQYAENKYWNKPSGLLDQMACAYGGLIAIDFENPEQPIIRPRSEEHTSELQSRENIV